MSTHQPIFRSIKTWLILCVLLTFVSAAFTVAALRSNNEHMASLRANVYQADKSGIGVPKSLQNLQAYVTAHMNTNLSDGAGSVYPPIQLEYTYLRLVQAQTQSALSGNGGLYTAAQAYCQKLDPYDFSGHNRVPCIENYVSTHGTNGTKQPTISPALYEFDFVSPSWSPDLAGWLLLVTILLATLSLLFVFYALYRRFFRSSWDKKIPRSNFGTRDKLATFLRLFREPWLVCSGRCLLSSLNHYSDCYRFDRVGTACRILLRLEPLDR